MQKQREATAAALAQVEDMKRRLERQREAQIAANTKAGRATTALESMRAKLTTANRELKEASDSQETLHSEVRSLRARLTRLQSSRRAVVPKKQLKERDEEVQELEVENELGLENETVSVCTCYEIAYIICHLFVIIIS